MLKDRLIYGTSRLAAGADARSSTQLIRQVLEAGIRHFDTAPVYGLGTAEALIGKLTEGRNDVRITTKLGLEPPSLPLLRTYARWARAKLRPRAPMLSRDHEPAPTFSRSPDANFDVDLMRCSLARSLERLRRDRIDILLLHGAFREDATLEVLAFLDQARDEKRVAAVGYSHNAPFDLHTDQAFPSTYVGQTAPPLDWYRGTRIGRDPLILHSIAKSGFHARHIDPSFAERLSRATAVVGPAGGLDATSIELAVLFAIAREAFSNASLVFASIDEGRLGSFLSAIHHIDTNLGTAPIGQAFFSEA